MSVCQCRDDIHRDARRRFAGEESSGIPELIYAIYGSLRSAFHAIPGIIYDCMCRRIDARCRFARIVSYGVPRLLSFDLQL
jgi:hypothetical protein